MDALYSDYKARKRIRTKADLRKEKKVGLDGEAAEDETLDALAKQVVDKVGPLLPPAATAAA
jgi:hypothetical protein